MPKHAFPTRPARRWFSAIVLIAACSGEASGPGLPLPPDIRTVHATRNPYNALSLIVSLHVRDADSVAVFYATVDPDPAAGSGERTPAVRVYGEAVDVPVLGLWPERTYEVRAIAWGPGGVVTAAPARVMTGSLPPDLPVWTAGGPDPSPGFVLFAAGRYVVVIDNTGRVVWYRAFENGAGLNVMAQPTGRFVARPQTPGPGDIALWVEMDVLGNVTRTFGCARGLAARFHDLISEPDGSYWILCDEVRTLDLSAMGGLPAARVTGTVVQHVAADGTLLWEWSAFDHFDLTDLDPAERTGPSVNWTHGNALDFDAWGNLILSFRSLGEVTKVNPTTGRILWRLGGRRNEFNFVGTTIPAFSRQHGVRVSYPDRLLLLDNVGDPTESRVELYAIDERERTATLVHQRGAGPGVVTPIGGSVQQLHGDRVLAAFGTAGRVVEYDADGRIVWSIAGNAGYVFRAQRIRSLYEPGVGTMR